jgi:hypothetical protein
MDSLLHTLFLFFPRFLFNPGLCLLYGPRFSGIWLTEDELAWVELVSGTEDGCELIVGWMEDAVDANDCAGSIGPDIIFQTSRKANDFP